MGKKIALEQDHYEPRFPRYDRGIEQMIQCSDSFVVLFVLVSPFFPRRLVGCMVLEPDCRMRVVARAVVVVVHKPHSLDFQYELADNKLAVVVVSKRYSPTQLPQTLLVERV